MKCFIKAMVVFILILAVFPSHAFGDFFTRVAQRQSIDVMREQGGMSFEQQLQQPKMIKVNGFYYKSHDKKNSGTIWVNGERMSEKQSRHGITIERLSEKDQG